MIPQKPGKAYVRGYEIETTQAKFVAVDKARDAEQVVNAITPFTLGNFTRIKPTSGIQMNLPNVNAFEKINLINSSAAVIGTARVRAIEYHSGTVGGGSEEYNLFIFDIVMSTGTFVDNAVKFLKTGGSTSSDFNGDFVLASSKAQMFSTGNNNLLYPLPNQAVKTKDVETIFLTF